MSTSRGPERDGRPPLAGERRRSRERALGLLYEAEAKGVRAEDLLAELPAPPEPYAEELVRGVGERITEIDALLADKARTWAVGRMPAVDRQVLRIAAFELLWCPEVPLAVVIDEALELVKQYSTADSARFVNGVLAALAAGARAGEAAGA